MVWYPFRLLIHSSVSLSILSETSLFLLSLWSALSPSGPEVTTLSSLCGRRNFSCSVITAFKETVQKMGSHKKFQSFSLSIDDLLSSTTKKSSSSVRHVVPLLESKTTNLKNQKIPTTFQSQTLPSVVLRKETETLISKKIYGSAELCELWCPRD